MKKSFVEVTGKTFDTNFGPGVEKWYVIFDRPRGESVSDLMHEGKVWIYDH